MKRDKRSLGHRVDLRGAGRDPAAGHARLPDPHARRASAAPDQRRRPAPDARLADELLMALFNKVVVANRGAVAARVLRALNAMGIHSVAVYSEADRGAPYLELASETAPSAARRRARATSTRIACSSCRARIDADALHPGYGFLSENAGFARAGRAAGHALHRTVAAWIDAMGHKTRARELAAQHGLPIGRGSGVLAGGCATTSWRRADEIGYPILVKPAAGGGGIGMLPARYATRTAGGGRARALDGRARLREPRGLPRAAGRAAAPRRVPGARRPRTARRAPVRARLLGAAAPPEGHRGSARAGLSRAPDRAAVRAHHIDRCARWATTTSAPSRCCSAPDGEFRFLEMNTRLQVEHGVTEEVTGVDLVRSADPLSGRRASRRHPAGRDRGRGPRDPGAGLRGRPEAFLSVAREADRVPPPSDRDIRVETGYRQGMVVTPHYDPLIAKVIAHGATRAQAIDRLCDALGAFDIEGLRAQHPRGAGDPALRRVPAGEVHTGLAMQVVGRQGASEDQAKGQAWRQRN